MLIQNPILPGFHPDPSVCRVGRDYYLVTSTFEYFPGVPIFHSTDLVNWEQIGHCLTRKSQLNLDQSWPSGGVYAPTIRYHDGRFIMITTNMTRDGNFYVSATDPAGPWSDPIYVDQDVFDPSLFFDDDGTVYYTRRGLKGIGQAEIDIATGALATELRTVTNGFICEDIEGPHLYKIDGRYYLMAAEGGTRFGHCEVIGRSDSPWGPFEPCPHNPIVTHRDQGHGRIRDVGHGELVQDHNENWWFFGLGTRHRHYANASILGRETFLAPVTWTNDGWPVIGTQGQLPAVFETPHLPAQRTPETGSWRDNFDDVNLDFRWNFLRNPYGDAWSLTESPGQLRLRGSARALDECDSPAFIGCRQQHFEMQASCTVDFAPLTENEEAGLTAYMNFEHHYAIAVTQRDGQRCVIVKKRVGDMTQEYTSNPIPEGPVTLTVQSTDSHYVFSFTAANSETQHLASGYARLLSPETSHDAYCWTGVYMGLYASGNGTPCQEPADFDWFEYRYEPFDGYTI